MRFVLLLAALALAADYAPPQEAKLESTAVIAAADEPGERMIITGVVYQSDGKTPAGGVVVHAYQTDAEGVYDAQGRNPSPEHRLKAWARTDDDGRYTFDTIRPAPYPGGGVPAHVHYVILREDGSEQKIDLYFVGDPYLRAGREADQGPQSRSLVRPAEKDDDGVLQVTADLMLTS